jgi:CHAT domain-containing protein
MLPIHAAGYHAESLPGEQQPVRTVLDRVVSSYTPTIRALRYARQHACHSSGISRALIVAMPVTPGLPGSELPKIQTEVARLQIILPDHVVLIEPDTAVAARVDETSAIPSRANVFQHLPGCSIAHFACHGISHPSDPSKSRLLLHDYKTSPLTVASLSLISHDHLELVYLSACRTAFTPAINLQDEAIHLTSAFQLAGSRHVIGTLWEINDTFAADVAADFYSGLRTETGTLDTDLAATALHQVIRSARNARPDAPSLWAAYIQVGA